MTNPKLTFTLLVSLLISACGRQAWGDNDLGDNFSLLVGDRTEDRVIVYCSGRSGGACYAGTFIVPSYSRHMDSTGHYAEYVDAAKANDDFIIAKTNHIKGRKVNYWIINKDFKITNCDNTNCDSIIQSHVFGPLDKSEFQNKILELKIELKFDDNE